VVNMEFGSHKYLSALLQMNIFTYEPTERSRHYEWDEGRMNQETGFDSRHRVWITSLSTVTRPAVE
jgi:hypothetical protein